MLTTQATPEMVAEWKAIWKAHRHDLQPNRKSGAELIDYLQSHYDADEFRDPYADSIVSGNITDNPHSAAKLPEGMQPRPRTFRLRSTQRNARLFAEDPIYKYHDSILVGIDEVTGEFHVELSVLLWDELFAFRGLDEADLANCYLVAEYLACREKQQENKVR